MNKDEIKILINQYQAPTRVAFSQKYPAFKRPIIFIRHQIRWFKNLLNFKIKYLRSNNYFPHIIARHQSVLRRKLGNSDLRLQEQKIINLRQAIKYLDAIIIPPQKIFSLWQIIGKPRYCKGYVDGMLLANGKVIDGLGGGLCQLSNFLYWIFLHAPVEIIERHHHSLDVFPDSGRTLPFGSGATILYNFLDLQIKNISDNPIQLKIWLTDHHLKGQLLSPKVAAKKFHVFEKNHCFVNYQGEYFRYNEIYRESNGEIEKVATNFAPVLYPVTKKYLQENNFKVLNFKLR